MSSATVPVVSPVRGDTLTVLTSAGPRLTKVWDSAEGKPLGYENAQQVSVKEVYVEDIYQLSALLTRLEKQRNSCIVRGRFIGHDAARELYPAEIEADARRGKVLKPPKDGFTLRRLRFFNDQPLHYFFLDIDRFVPVGVDPVTQPQAAIEQYIAKHLPPCFQGATYHWQLSSGAGHPDNEGVLKAHVAFWLRTPTLGEHLKAWAQNAGIAMDTSVFGAVQPNYTAAPVFVDGVADPVPQRSGLCEGWAGDDVDLVIDSAVLERARAVHKSRREMVDPREKDGLIGLFHRTYEIEEVVERWLGDVFEFVDDWRLNFLRSASGAAEGAGVTDNRQGIFNTHSSDPLGNRATNKWDLVRHYLYGHLDEALDRDERALLGPGGWPSQQAMTEMVQALPEIQAALGEQAAKERAERDVLLQSLFDEIDAAAVVQDLEEKVAKKAARVKSLSDSERGLLAKRIVARNKALGGAATLDQVRGWLRYRTSGGGPGFAHVNDEGHPLCTLENLTALLRQLEITIRYNVISKNVEVLVPGASGTRDNRDNATLATVLSECEKVRMPTRHVPQFLLSLADQNLFNPVMSWITSRPWDGVSRLEDFYATVVEAEDTPAEMKKLLMRKWLIQAVAAAASPDGIAAQGILTFTGEQNIGKTTWFRRLAPVELDLVKTGLTLDLKSKDSILTALRYWIVELGEVDATFRKSDISALKSFVTQDTDNIRRPYAMNESCYGRRTVFGASVNDEEFLADSTGNRRFWTIHAVAFQLDHGVDMQQLWAEVYELWKGGEAFHLDQGQVARLNTHNAQFAVSNPVFERLAGAFDWEGATSWEWVTVTQALIAAGIRDPQKRDTIEGSTALRKLNGKRRRKSNSKVLFAVPANFSDFLEGKGQ